MPDDSESGPLVVLWVVAAVMAVVFFGFEILALRTEPPAALLGLGGLCTGALLTTVVSWTRRRQRADRPVEVLAALEALAEQMRTYELGQERVAELEERLDFAERILSRAPDATPLDDGRVAP